MFFYVFILTSMFFTTMVDIDNLHSGCISVDLDHLLSIYSLCPVTLMKPGLADTGV